MGDAHSIMGRGELAVHSIDITADITVRAELLKGVTVPGPILLPNAEDLPAIAKPHTPDERQAFQRLAEQYGLRTDTEMGPVQFIGTGKDLNAAVDNAIDRAHQFLGISRDEVMNRATVTGEVQITRLPGTVQLSLLLPRHLLEAKGLWSVVQMQYGL
ncbi:acetamidase/formamidase [Sulfobacillus acidophilus TPY]|nr:acetamidase/formamidase [Sulfobacillus acidophilus TPY]